MKNGSDLYNEMNTYNDQHPVFKTGIRSLDEIGFIREGKVSLIACEHDGSSPAYYEAPFMDRSSFGINIAANCLAKSQRVSYLYLGKLSVYTFMTRFIALGIKTDLINNLFVFSDPYSKVRVRMLLKEIANTSPDLLIIDTVNAIGLEIIQWLSLILPECSVLLLGELLSDEHTIKADRRPTITDFPCWEDIAPYIESSAVLYRWVKPHFTSPDMKKHGFSLFIEKGSGLDSRPARIFYADDNGLLKEN